MKNQENKTSFKRGGHSSFSSSLAPSKKTVESYILFDKDWIFRLPKGKYRFRDEPTIYESLYDLVLSLLPRYSLDLILPALTWKEFENFVRDVLGEYGFFSSRTFRFKGKKRRYEIDIIARRQRDIVAIDAKRWNRNTASSSSLYRMAEMQQLRCRALIHEKEALELLFERLHLPRSSSKEYHLYPIILVSTHLSKITYLNGTAIVSAAHLNDFFNNFELVKSNLLPLSFRF